MALDLFVPAKAKSHRQQRVAQELRHLLADIFIRGDLPPCVDEQDNTITLKASITVTSVDISPDLRHATIFVMPLGGEAPALALDYLNTIQGFFKKAIGRELKLRAVPTVTFRLDKGFSHNNKVGQILSDIS
jgi:ribosome-binding factor A